jgi:hypothetical protein
MEWGLVLFIVVIAGLLVTGLIKNLWTQFAGLCFIGTLIVGILIWAVIKASLTI